MPQPPSVLTPSDPAQFDAGQIERLWNWLLHEGNLFNSRQQLFAVAEAMFFGAYATLTTAAQTQRWPVVVMIIAGGLSCVFWFYANYYQLKRTIYPLREVLKARLGEYVYVRNQSHGRLATTVLMGYAFPIALALAWLALFYFCVHVEGAPVPQRRG